MELGVHEIVDTTQLDAHSCLQDTSEKRRWSLSSIIIMMRGYRGEDGDLMRRRISTNYEDNITLLLSSSSSSSSSLPS